VERGCKVVGLVVGDVVGIVVNGLLVGALVVGFLVGALVVGFLVVYTGLTPLRVGVLGNKISSKPTFSGSRIDKVDTTPVLRRRKERMREENFIMGRLGLF
jgi:TRAP-type mannitol/chloroaromatic compound transport system permease large subunit